MNINSAFDNGVTGIFRAQELASSASQKIAQAGTTNPDQDLVQPAVDLKRAEIATAANAKSIETANKTIGSLLDIRA